MISYIIVPGLSVPISVFGRRVRSLTDVSFSFFGAKSIACAVNFQPYEVQGPPHFAAHGNPGSGDEAVMQWFQGLQGRSMPCEKPR